MVIVARVIIWYMIVNILISLITTAKSGNEINNMVKLVNKEDDIKEFSSTTFGKVFIYAITFIGCSLLVVPISIIRIIDEYSNSRAEKLVSGHLRIDFDWNADTSEFSKKIFLDGNEVLYEDLSKAERRVFRAIAERFIWSIEMADPDKTKATVADIDRMKAECRLDY